MEIEVDILSNKWHNGGGGEWHEEIEGERAEGENRTENGVIYTPGQSSNKLILIKEGVPQAG